MTKNTLKATLLGATLLVGSAVAAIAQQPAVSTFDPAQLPAMSGTVAHYDLTPRGGVDGLILQDGTEIHFPPHLGLEVVALVKPGDAVTVHGLKARALPLVQAMSVTADASGKTVIDTGPGAHGPKRPGGPGHPHAPQRGTELQAQGVVKIALHGPRGELNGVMLENGTLIHLPPPEATRLAAQLQPGQSIAVRGEGVDNVLGRSIAASAIGPTEDKLAAVAAPPHGPRGPGHDRPEPAAGRPGAPASPAAR